MPPEPSLAVIFRGDAVEAYLVKTRLESEGIPADVWDENASNAWGGAAIGPFVRVAVRKSDEAKAREILS